MIEQMISTSIKEICRKHEAKVLHRESFQSSEEKTSFFIHDQLFHQSWVCYQKNDKFFGIVNLMGIVTFWGNESEDIHNHHPLYMPKSYNLSISKQPFHIYTQPSSSTTYTISVYTQSHSTNSTPNPSTPQPFTTSTKLLCSFPPIIFCSTQLTGQNSPAPTTHSSVASNCHKYTTTLRMPNWLANLTNSFTW